LPIGVRIIRTLAGGPHTTGPGRPDRARIRWVCATGGLCGLRGADRLL
jgi:hypothetical protein